jgi:hypothetical protein
MMMCEEVGGTMLEELEEFTMFVNAFIDAWPFMTQDCFNL